MNVCQRNRIKYFQFPLRFENKPLKYRLFADAKIVWRLLALQLRRFALTYLWLMEDICVQTMFLAMKEKNSYPVLFSADNSFLVGTLITIGEVVNFNSCLA